MKIGEICKLAGVTKHTLRHYEDLELIKSTERPAGSRTYRDYEASETLERIKLIRLGKSLGLGLREMQPFLEAFFDHDLSDEDHKKLWESRLVAIDQKLKDLRQVRKMVMQKIKNFDDPDKQIYDQPKRKKL